MNLKPRAQEAAWARLLQLSRSLPQALIFLGPAGVGKRRAVKALFQVLHCTGGAAAPEDAAPSLFGAAPEEPAPAVQERTEPCGQCVSCRKIAEGKHVDLIEIGPKGENIPVDDLREMKKSLYFPPVEGKKRFIIIDEAHKLNASSANMLLKTLEEPPEHTRFFLITHERGLLLPTIVSRCQFVYFAPLDEETLKGLLSELQLELPQELLPLCVDLMAGGVARAALFADEKVLAFLKATNSALRATSKADTAWAKVVALADELGHEEWMLELFLDVLVRIAHAHAIDTRSLEEARASSELALDAAYLRRRLDRYANKKLIALAAAELAARAR